MFSPISIFVRIGGTAPNNTLFTTTALHELSVGRCEIPAVIAGHNSLEAERAWVSAVGTTLV